MRRGERFNVVSHAAGVVLTLAGMAALVVPAVREGEFTKAIGFAIYGCSLTLAFLLSTLYHSVYHVVPEGTRDLFRRFDRVAIYWLIAGTYTPIAVVGMRNRWGWLLLAVVWLLALYGTIEELREARAHKRPTVALYIIMGWLALLAAKPMMAALTADGFLYLLAGGVFYTVGAIVARLAMLPRNHEIWHVLALAGSACHFMVMFYYVN